MNLKQDPQTCSVVYMVYFDQELWSVLNSVAVNSVIRAQGKTKFHYAYASLHDQPKEQGSFSPPLSHSLTVSLADTQAKFALNVISFNNICTKHPTHTHINIH